MHPKRLLCALGRIFGSDPHLPNILTSLGATHKYYLIKYLVLHSNFLHHPPTLNLDLK